MGKLNKKQRKEFSRRFAKKMEFFRQMQGKYSCTLGTFTPDNPENEDFSTPEGGMWTPEDEGWWHDGIKVLDEG